MINVQKFLDDITAALWSGETQSDIQANAQKALDVLRADVDAARENANRNDKAKIRDLLMDAWKGLNGTDLDPDRIRVAPSEAKAVLSNLSSQIKAMLLSLSEP